jgi:CRP-like cAMP-binding protein
MLTVIEKVIFLQNVDVFDDVPSEQLAYLAAIAEEVSYLKDEVIYRRSEPSDALYLVLQGGVRLHQDSRDITLAGPRQAFGTWALFDEEPRVVTATAVEDTNLLRVDREDFIDLLADHVQITRGILKKMADRLRGLLGRVQRDGPSQGA